MSLGGGKPGHHPSAGSRPRQKAGRRQKCYERRRCSPDEERPCAGSADLGEGADVLRHQPGMERQPRRLRRPADRPCPPMTFADYGSFAIADCSTKARAALRRSFATEFIDAVYKGELVEGTGEIVRAGRSIICVPTSRSSSPSFKALSVARKSSWPRTVSRSTGDAGLRKHACAAFEPRKWCRENRRIHSAVHTGFRHRSHVSAIVANHFVLAFVMGERDGAVPAFQFLAAGAAEDHRRDPWRVEQDHDLLFACEPVSDFGGEFTRNYRGRFPNQATDDGVMACITAVSRA